MAQRWIETLAEDRKRRSVTIVGTNAVYYAVETLDPSNEWVTTWEAKVEFGQDKAHRAGGYAFQAAAAEQERLLRASGV